jgi:adenylate kinase
MRLVFLGAPGSGKGTQAKRLARKFKLDHISTGDMLRDAIKAETPVGKKARTFMDAGELVPDDVILGMIKEELTKGSKGFIFDGFPRTRAQAEGLDDILRELGLSVSKVINLDVPNQVIVDRLGARRLCRNCGQEYNLKTRAPKRDNICDICGGQLYQRPDDSAEVVTKRLAVYHDKSKPVEDFYRLRGILIEVDGSREFDQVFDSVTKAVAEVK